MDSRVALNTELGSVEGLSNGLWDSFLGLPYATPPLGSLRFAPAQLWSKRWDGVKDATTFGSPCHQSTGYWDQDPSEHPFPSAPPPSEDCLFLNIFRPSLKPSSELDAAVTKRLLPVMLWVHGGGLCGGAGSSAWQHGGKFAHAGDAIVVTINYRLGPLGFLAHPELEKTYGASGGANGLLDQITALRWVQAHIRAFGGNPSEVTLAGESSGGVSTCAINSSPRASGLFRRAIVQSGPCIVSSEGWGPGSAQAGYTVGFALRQQLNASTIAELRALPPQVLQWDNTTLSSDLFSGYWLDGTVDDNGFAVAAAAPVLPWPPMVTYSSGKTVASELIVGHTSQDGTAAFYSKAPLANASVTGWDGWMEQRFGAKAAAVKGRYSLERYSHMPYTAVSASFVSADGDERVACPSRRLAELASRQGVHVYAFAFHHLEVNCDVSFELQVLPWWQPRERLARSGWASHGSEVKYLFNTTAGPDNCAAATTPVAVARSVCPKDPSEVALATEMMRRWGDFVSGRRPWEPFKPRGSLGSSATRTLRLRTADAGGSDVVNNYKAGDCAFWARHG